MGHLFILDKHKKSCGQISVSQFSSKIPHFLRPKLIAHEAWDTFMTLAIHPKISNRIEKAHVKIIFKLNGKP